MNDRHKPIRNIFFDLDGTLINSLTDIAAALNQMRGHFNLAPVDNKKVAEFIGPGFPSTIKKVLHDLDQETTVENIDHALKLTREFYAQNLGNNTHVYPGVIETLTQLKTQGVKLAVVTNAEERHAIKLLNKLNLLDFFEVIVGGNTTAFYKPNPEPLQYAMEQLAASKDNSVMVGDSESDYLCAKAVAVPCVFVTHGYHYGFDFDTHQPHAVIDRFEQLPESIGL